MMSKFANMGTAGLEQSEDRLGGFAALETNVYTGKIKYAYASESGGGAMAINLGINIAGGNEYRETVYISNKQKENFFLNPQDKTKKVPLPGFTIINDLCIVSCDKPLSEMDTEEKTMNVYDSKERKELLTKVDMLTELVGKDVSLAIVQTLENKQVKNETTGAYEPTAETINKNSIAKVFHPTAKLTVPEALAGISPADAAFQDKWIEKHKGVTQDKTNKTTGAPGKPAGKPAPGQTSAAPARKSLFG